MTYAEFNSYHRAHRCVMCGCQNRDHRGGSEQSPIFNCPTISSWGKPEPFPRTYHEIQDKDFQPYWDRVEKYWNTQGTQFTPEQ